MSDAKAQCQSIKSKKHPTLRCPNSVHPSKGKDRWCSMHVRSQIAWESPSHHVKVISKKQKLAAEKIHNFWRIFGRSRMRRAQGPATFIPDSAHNDKDIYSYDPATSIPLQYRFSYSDSKKHIWLFDLRFLLHLIQYGNELKNPFTQEQIPPESVERLQKRAEALRKKNVAIVYLEKDELTSEQIWNQKVLDVFLKLSSLGYGANILWFESMQPRHHELFYTRLFELWNVRLGLSEDEKERIVPGHKSGRAPLFKWSPLAICGHGFDLKWWRKQNLLLMKAFLTRSEDKSTQGCGALYVLTALANTHPRCGEAYPWLLAE